MKSFLSGMPRLKLGLNDKVLFDARGGRRGGGRNKGVDMEDIRFHHCVPLNRFENDRTITFIPPDGAFDLMTYRLSTKVKPLIWAQCQIQKHSGSRVEYLIKVKSNFKRRSTANDVEIIVPVPADADSPNYKSSIGKVDWMPSENQFIWKIKNLQGEKKYLMRAHFGLPSIQNEELESKGDSVASTPLKIKFNLPYYTCSGLQVRYLKITEDSGYQALPWVRYITEAGDYAIRIQ
jgi:AP-1 complex subunit mu